MKKILYATSLGAGAPYVFRYALSLAAAYDARITVVHATEPLSTFAQSLIEHHISHHQSEQIHEEAYQTVKNKLLDRARKLIDKESDSLPNGPTFIEEIAVMEGPAYRVILEKAEEIGADIIVMGCQRHTVLESAMLGSTATKVAHQATIPTCLVRIPEGYQEVGF